LINEIVQQFPRGRSYLVDQLQRAGTSVSLNTAEGAVNFQAVKKEDFIAWQNALPRNVLEFLRYVVDSK
jgi:four helix bundle protein